MSFTPLKRIHNISLRTTQPAAENVYKLSFDAPDLAFRIKPGQFISIMVPNDSTQLVRVPLSCAHADCTIGIIEVYLAVVGDRTGRLASLKPKDVVSALGPNGRGWKMTTAIKRALLIAEGMGMSSLLMLAEWFSRHDVAYDAVVSAEYAKKLIGVEELRSLGYSQVCVCTDDGSPGYKTLRIILCKVALLVEGDADELVVQRAYMDMHQGDLPIQNGIDVISVGTSFLRFLEVAEAIDKPAVALTDNDGDIAARKRKYADYKHVSVLMAEDNMDRQAVSYPKRVLPVGKEKGVNYNTLESEIYESADKKVLEKILERDVSNRDATLKHMENNKTETALKIFDSELSIDYPPYIVETIEWADKQIEEVEDN